MPPFGEEEVEAQDLSEGTGEEEVDSTESENEESELSDDTEGDEQAETSEEEEAQDDDEEQEEEPADLKNQNGAFDWKKISAKLPSIGPQLERSFKEAQRTTSMAVQKSATLEKELTQERAQAQELKQQAALLQQFNQVYETDPEVQQAIQRHFQRQNGNYVPQGSSSGQGLPPGVDPNDPLVPLILQQQQVVSQLANQHRQQEMTRKQHEEREQFRQGLMGARDTFTSLLGRPPTQEELQRVAEKMRGTGMLDGSVWVPSLFVQEIQKGAKRDFFKSRDEKKKLPQRSKSSVRATSTSGSKSLRDAFEEAWEEHM